MFVLSCNPMWEGADILREKKGETKPQRYRETCQQTSRQQKAEGLGQGNKEAATASSVLMNTRGSA